jgi:hypothetical protein
MRSQPIDPRRPLCGNQSLYPRAAQFRCAVVEYVGWFNNSCLHESLGDIPLIEFEQHHAVLTAAIGPNPGDRLVVVLSPRAAERLTERHFVAAQAAPARNGVDRGLSASIAVATSRAAGHRTASSWTDPPRSRSARPSGLAPRDGGGKPEPEGSTTVTTTSTETN